MTVEARLVRALAGAATGALAAALSLFVAYVVGGGFTTSLDTQPSIIRGLYPTEREPDGLTFAWTRDRVTLTFEGLDRSAPWTLVLRAKAGRGPGLPAPQATLDVDGVSGAATTVGSAWQDIRAELPPDTTAPLRRPTRVTLNVAPTFVPGPGDSRSLGLILDEVRLTSASRVPWVPRRALVAAAIAGGLVGAAIAALGVPLGWALGLTIAFTIAQAAALAGGAGPYTRVYLDLLPRVAGYAAFAFAALGAGIGLVRRDGLSATAGAAIGVSIVGVVLELEGLLHPSKAIIDAVFHAHRFDGVLQGRYFFTQPIGSGVEFPYAIGLYVTAMPWASLVRDHVMLLRLVVTATHALAALALYPLVVRRWGNPGAAVAAVAAYHLAPLPLVVMSNANQTYAFGQSIATIALAAAMTWPLRWRRPFDGLALAALIALGLLSHVGLILLLGGLIGASALAVALRAEPADRQAGWVGLAAAALATILAFGLYYVHFVDAFRSARAVTQSTAAPASPEVSEDGQSPSPVSAGSSRPARFWRAVVLAVSAFGLPLLALALAGLSRVRPRIDRDRLTLMVATALAFGILVAGVSVLAPVEPRFERYTDEFISRLYYALNPVVAIAAGSGAMWLWQRNIAGRSAAVVLGSLAVSTALQMWLGWTG